MTAPDLPTERDLPITAWDRLAAYIEELPGVTATSGNRPPASRGTAPARPMLINLYAPGIAALADRIEAGDEAREQVERVREVCDWYDRIGDHARTDWIRRALDGTSGGKPSRCPDCRHMPHGEVCFNMASDNDCNCKSAGKSEPMSGGEPSDG